MSWITDMLDWMHDEVGIENTVFDRLYEAVKDSDSDTAQAVIAWYARRILAPTHNPGSAE